jgi:Zn-finger nucleic acid-binding protein
VLGCPTCETIYSSTVYYGIDGKLCPQCGHEAKELGELPYIVQDDTNQFFLMNQEGEFTGPYSSEADAQCSLWDWFNRSATNAEAPKEGLRLVASDGVLVKET